MGGEPGGLASRVDCIIGLDVFGREGTPGISVSLVGYEHWGHRPDAKHLSDGGLQHEEVAPVTESWCTAETYILVNLLMDLLLHLRARGRCT